jgi:hypothetical protein
MILNLNQSMFIASGNKARLLNNLYRDFLIKCYYFVTTHKQDFLEIKLKKQDY